MKPIASKRDYGLRPNVTGNYREMMVRVTDKSIFNQRPERHSEFKRPYFKDNYHAMEHYYTPPIPSVTRPTLYQPDSPEQIVVLDDDVIVDFPETGVKGQTVIGTAEIPLRNENSSWKWDVFTDNPKVIVQGISSILRGSHKVSITLDIASDTNGALVTVTAKVRRVGTEQSISEGSDDIVLVTQNPATWDSANTSKVGTVHPNISDVGDYSYLSNENLTITVYRDTVGTSAGTAPANTGDGPIDDTKMVVWASHATNGFSPPQYQHVEVYDITTGQFMTVVRGAANGPDGTVLWNLIQEGPFDDEFLVFYFSPNDFLHGVALYYREIIYVQYQQSRGTVSKTAGKWYIEFPLDLYGTVQVSIHIGVGNANSTAHRGLTEDSYVVRLAQTVVSHGGAGGTNYGVTPSSGDFLMMAVDIDDEKIWFGYNGSWLGAGADPATGDFPASPVMDVPSPIFPVISFNAEDLDPAKISMQSGHELNKFSDSPPDGYSPWYEEE